MERREYLSSDWHCVRRRCRYRDKEEQKKFSKLLLNKHCGLSSSTSNCVLTCCNRSQVKYLFWRPGARNVWPNNFIVEGWFTINLTSYHFELPKPMSTLLCPFSCKTDNAPIFWRWTKNSCQSCPPFLNATFPRWKHLLSTFTVNDRSITRSSFEINVLIPRRDAMTSDALIDRRIPDIRNLTNQSTLLGLLDQWEEGHVTGSWHVVTGHITDMLCVTLSVLTRVPCGVTYKHGICPLLPSKISFRVHDFLFL